MKILRKRLSSLFFLIIAFILSFEIFLRATCRTQLQRWTQFQYQSDSILGYRYKPNSSGIINNVAFNRKYSINSLGFPGRDFVVKKDTGVYRIIIVGTSDDTGLSTDGPLNYVDILNEEFKRDGYKVEVINCSIDGRDKGIRNIKLIKNECIGYNPDLIILANEYPLRDRHRYRSTYKNIVINYADPNSNLDSAKTFIDNEILEKDWRLYLFDYSYIYRYFAKYYLDNKDNKESRFAQWMERPFFKNRNKIQGYARREIYWWKNLEKKFEVKIYSEEESLHILKELDTELSSKKINLVLFDKYLDSESNLYLAKIFGKNNIKYLPLNVLFKEGYNFGILDGHSSQEGHKAIAKALYLALINSKVVFF